MNIVFFGSFQHYSALILESLIRASHDSPLHVVGVVTTPPMPVGRKQIITKTPVHLLADKNNIPVYTPISLSTLSPNDAHSRTPAGSAGSEDVDLETKMPETDYFVTAGYGKILTREWLKYPTYGSLNLHFSLLPKFRGANPAEWAIMLGETVTGITLMNMNEGLDKGDIIAQKEVSITANDTRETLYQKLYELGAQELPSWLTNIQKATPQPEKSPTPYAALLKREDGFIPWTTIQKAIKGEVLKVDDFPSKHLKLAFEKATAKEKFTERLPQALAGYPSLWTLVKTSKGEKRMKIISFMRAHHPASPAGGDAPLHPSTVQLEGQQPAFWNQIKNQIIES